MRNFDSWSAEHIDNCISYTKRLLSGLNEWYGMLGRHIMEPPETQNDRVAFVKFMRETEKKLEEINRDLYRADQNFVTAVESGSKPSYAYESKKLIVRESGPVSDKTMKRNMSERIDIDMWYGDPFKKGYYGADAYFSDSDFVYRGHIYDPKTGEIIGDYECDDSVEIEKMFHIK